ncbi:MAG: hypothetical protein PUE84_04510, partial [Firmicutes bacterium]|nr:hypothetical protein [Bacillota bacterium]
MGKTRYFLFDLQKDYGTIYKEIVCRPCLGVDKSLISRYHLNLEANTEMINLSEFQNIHCIGIGGIGLSAIAE